MGSAALDISDAMGVWHRVSPGFVNSAGVGVAGISCVRACSGADIWFPGCLSERRQSHSYGRNLNGRFMCARVSQVFLRAFSKRPRRSKSVFAVWLIRRGSSYTAGVPARESVPASARACMCVSPYVTSSKSGLSQGAQFRGDANFFTDD